MALTVFYAWQSDSPRKTNKNFIQKALMAALKKFNVDKDDAEKVTLDMNTMGVAGTPPITETILGKIDACCAFVPDMTFVAKTPTRDGQTPRMLCNPNVLIEYGYAIKACTYARMIPIMNTVFGEPIEGNKKNLPFDMEHLRKPITYCLAEDATDEVRQGIKNELVSEVHTALKLILAAQESTTQNDIDTGMASTPSIRHDTDLFRTIDKFMHEEYLQGFLRNLGANHQFKNTQIRPIDEFSRFSQKVGNQFMSIAIEQKRKLFSNAIRWLNNFISVNFFCHPTGQTDVLAMQPNRNIDREGSGAADIDYYDALALELGKHLNIVEEAYSEFRLAVKRTLAI